MKNFAADGSLFNPASQTSPAPAPKTRRRFIQESAVASALVAVASGQPPTRPRPLALASAGSPILRAYRRMVRAQAAIERVLDRPDLLGQPFATMTEAKERALADAQSADFAARIKLVEAIALEVGFDLPSFNETDPSFHRSHAPVAAVVIGGMLFCLVPADPFDHGACSQKQPYPIHVRPVVVQL